jgi:protein-S-isoprenylcysteine O-methyltransferase Ste14
MIYGGLVVAGLVLQQLKPVPLTGEFIWPGYAILAVGLLLDIWAMATMFKAHTNILPHRPAANLVTHGPFAHMRNPIYVGNTIATVGLGLALQNGWLVLAAPIAAILTHHLAVKREAAHLRAKFGKDWEHYASRVKAWWLV